MDCFSDSKKPLNEDMCWAHDGCFALLDGATDLGAVSQFNAHWFASELVHALSATMPNRDLSLQACLNQALDSVRSLAPQGFNQASASVILARTDGKVLHYLSLGDCTGVLRYKDGTIQVIKDESVTHLDNIVVAMAEEVAANQGLTLAQALKSDVCQAQLLVHRNLKNTPQGYYTCDPIGDGVAHATLVQLPLHDLDALLLMSDGYADCVVNFHLFPTFGDLMTAVEHRGTFDVLQELYAAQDADHSQDRYPRLKHSDDATAVFSKL